MELRDYLMPGEYVITVVGNLDISPGGFDGLAITNKRLMVFSTKSGLKLFRKDSQGNIKNLKSVFFENTSMIRMIIREGVLGNPKSISLIECIKLKHEDGSWKYSEHELMGVIKSKLSGPQISEVKEIIENALLSLASNGVPYWSEKEKAWIIDFVFENSTE